ncbi:MULTISPECIES: hypothetical protein [unclassified Nonomuraea]|uniref:hypothetical protein n=1 Tax=unclassified Nonomuraea TaxID=2593643 RepID=UPI0033D4B7F8
MTPRTRNPFARARQRADTPFWGPLTDIRRLIDKRDIVSGTSMNALLYVLAEV